MIISYLNQKKTFNAMEAKLNVFQQLAQAGGSSEFDNYKNIRLICNQGGKVAISELNKKEGTLLNLTYLFTT